MDGNDFHSINPHIHTMLWDYAFFTAINELRRIAALKPAKKVSFNHDVLQLFDVGFVTKQTTAIRRLIEPPNKNPKRQVISLRRVLADIDQNRHIITRENYVCHDGLPYDYESVYRNEVLKSISKKRKVVHGATTGSRAWVNSQSAHEKFDILSKVHPSNRKRTDLIAPQMIVSLNKQLDRCKSVAQFVNKFVAHGADPSTRKSLTKNQKGISLNQLKAAHEMIYSVADFVLSQLLNQSTLGGLSVAQYDCLDDLDKAWATKLALRKAHEKMDAFRKEVDGWKAK